MDYKEFTNSTINRLEQPAFDAIKNVLVGEYLSFSIIREENITRDILSEKVCDYFEKLEIKTQPSLDKLGIKTKDSFDKQIENYVKTWDSIVSPRIVQTPKPKKKDTAPVITPRARKYYDKACSIKDSRSLSTRNMIDYSRIMICLYMAIVQNGYKPIADFEYSIDRLIPDKVIENLKKHRDDAIPFMKGNKFNTKELYCSDTCFFILVIIMLHVIINDRIEAEVDHE